MSANTFSSLSMWLIKNLNLDKLIARQCPLNETDHGEFGLKASGAQAHKRFLRSIKTCVTLTS